MKKWLLLTVISACLATNYTFGMQHNPEVRNHKTFIEHLKIIDSRSIKQEGTLYSLGERVPNYPQILLTEPQFEKLKQSLSHILAPDQDMQRCITLDIARVEDPANPMLKTDCAPTVVQRIFNPVTITACTLCAITGYLVAKQAHTTSH